MDKLFLIPGLGADVRLFKNLDLSKFDIVPIAWNEPKPNDSLHTYAQKLINNYQITEKSIVLGVSLGGMLTAEIVGLLNLKKAIIISSVKSSAEIPWYFKIFKFIPIYNIIPSSLLLLAGRLFKPFFGMATKHDKLLFDSMLNNTSPSFMRWAINAILCWNTPLAPANICHIVGDRDFILPHRYINDAVIVHRGTHMMVLDKAKEINQLIDAYLTK